MGSLAHSLVQFALGNATSFSWLAWLLLTLLLMGVGSVLVAAVPGLFEPIAIEIAVRPKRIAWWLIISVIGVPLILILMILTIVGAPFSVVLAFAFLAAGAVGYLAFAYLMGDRISRAVGRELPSWQALPLGVLCFRVIRLIPFVGASIHTFIMWISFAAATAIMWDLTLSWHRRRLPDHVQFKDDNVIEWNPPEAE